MKAFSTGSAVAGQHVSTYTSFVGVDFSTDPMLVDQSHSPYALNLMADEGGMPEKRPGWRTLQRMEGRINGLFRCEMGDKEHYLCHAGTKIWKLDMTGGVTAQNLLLRDGLCDGPSHSFYMMGKLYILTGSEYLEYDGDTLGPVEGYVPTLQINRNPDGTGGSELEKANLISPWGIEEFIGNGSGRIFQLCRKGLDADPVECQVYNSTTAAWETKTEGSDFTVDRTAGTVTFKTAPAASELVNVKITAAKTVEGNREKITGAKNGVVFNDGTIFVCGSVKGIDFRSGYRQPNYFPENGYDRVGSDENDIVGYCRIGEYLGIIKESSEQDSTVFLRWQESDKDVEGNLLTMFHKKPGIVGIGALSSAAIGVLVDEPVFLSRRGVYSITSNAITSERTVQNRSLYCDNRLTNEPGLEKACTVEWDGRFLVCVNSHCYVLESRRKSYPNGSSNGYVCECYYWENIPAVCFLAVGDALYFGTGDGRICRFNTDIETLDRYNDDGEAITAVWSTCMDDDGYPHRLKTMIRRGCAVTLKPFTRSGVAVSIRTEKDTAPREICRSTLDIFSWEDIDFSRFTFNANDAARDVVLRHTERRYKRLQFFVKNEAVNEGFGIYKIVKSYIVLGLAKK